MSRKFLTYSIFCCLVIFIAHSMEVYAQAEERFEFSQKKMGTQFRIILYAMDAIAAESAAKAAFKRIDELNQILSIYEKDSELSRLNKTAENKEIFHVSSSLFALLDKALEISRKTSGAFDITVGPMVDLWQKSRRTEKLPSQHELTEARESVGYHYVELHSKNSAIELRKKGMKLNSGGIGKGYAADQALEVLKEHQITAALVDAGGDIVAGNAPPDKEGWEIQLRVLNDNSELVEKIITVSNAAVATSGDLYQFVEIDGTRYSHIVNPQTGLGLTDQSRVTVIAPNGTIADSYATAVSVLGPEKGIQVIENLPDTEVDFIQNHNEKYESWNSKGFEKIIEMSSYLSNTAVSEEKLK